MSSRKQATPDGDKQSSLQNQIERVEEFIAEKWGRKAAVETYYGVGSGLNFNRPELLKLIGDILAGKYRNGFVVVQDHTRLCRFGIDLINHICRIGECEIVYVLQNNDERTLNEELADDVLAVLTHFTARCSGAKVRAILGIKIPEDVMKDAFIWYKSGMGYRAIVAKLKKEGRDKDEEGRKITNQVLRKRLLEAWNTLERLYGDDHSEKNSFVQFCNKYVRRSKSDKTFLSRVKLVETYQTWCKEQGVEPMPCMKISETTAQLNWKKKVGKRDRIIFVGLSLTTNKRKPNPSLPV